MSRLFHYCNNILQVIKISLVLHLSFWIWILISFKYKNSNKLAEIARANFYVTVELLRTSNSSNPCSEPDWDPLDLRRGSAERPVKLTELTPWTLLDLKPSIVYLDLRLVQNELPWSAKRVKIILRLKNCYEQSEQWLLIFFKDSQTTPVPPTSARTI